MFRIVVGLRLSSKHPLFKIEETYETKGAFDVAHAAWNALKSVSSRVDTVDSWEERESTKLAEQDEARRLHVVK